MSMSSRPPWPPPGVTSTPGSARIGRVPALPRPGPSGSAVPSWLPGLKLAGGIPVRYQGHWGLPTGSRGHHGQRGTLGRLADHAEHGVGLLAWAVGVVAIGGGEVRHLWSAFSLV